MSDYYKKLYYGVTENNQIITKEINRLENNNKHLKLQLDQALKDYEELLIKIDKAIEEINYMITNADITEISAIKLKQILGDKE